MGKKRDRIVGMTFLVGLAVSCLYVYNGTGNSRVSANSSVNWMWNDFDRALEKAQAENKCVLLDFWAVWCKECKEMDKEFEDPEVFNLLDDFVLVKVDVDEVPQLKAQFAVGGLPVIVVVNNKGEEVARVVGYQDAGQLEQLLQQVQEVLTQDL